MSSQGLYQKLTSTAEKFVQSTSFSPPSTEPDKFALREICAEDYKHSWGHDYFISSRPHLNTALTYDKFIAHLDRMTPKLESAHAEITDITVDEFQRKVVARTQYRMTPKGSKETVVNDLMWILQMDEHGEKVECGIEFIDGDASARLMQLIKNASAH